MESFVLVIARVKLSVSVKVRANKKHEPMLHVWRLYLSRRTKNYHLLLRMILPYHPAARDTKETHAMKVSIQ